MRENQGSHLHGPLPKSHLKFSYWALQGYFFCRSDNFANKMIELTENMAPYAPSMKFDFDYKRPMEIEYIYTRPIEAAMRAGYEMRKVSILEKQLRFMEKQRQSS